MPDDRIAVLARKRVKRRPPGPAYDDRPNKAETPIGEAWDRERNAGALQLEGQRKKSTVARQPSGSYAPPGKQGADPIPLTPVKQRKRRQGLLS